jgi:hypothetical protein
MPPPRGTVNKTKIENYDETGRTNGHECERKEMARRKNGIRHVQRGL